MNHEKPNYYAILTAEVRYDKRLRPNAKLLYAEITSLSNKSGKCWASNSYFAELYEVSRSVISRWVGQLKEYGYVDVSYTYKSGSKEIDQRIITLSDHVGRTKCAQGRTKKTKIILNNNSKIPADFVDLSRVASATEAEPPPPPKKASDVVSTPTLTRKDITYDNHLNKSLLNNNGAKAPQPEHEGIAVSEINLNI